MVSAGRKQFVRWSSIGLVSLIWVGCAGNDQLTDLQRQVQLQSEQIQRQGKEIEALQNSMNRAPSYRMPPAACDESVMRQALDRGDRQKAQGNIQVAAGYYQDALAACPGNPQAELKVAHADEELGDRAAAITHYQRVLAAGNASQAAAARQALARLSGS
jgi:tetratricopeptide (TPR) repeat protein